MNFNERELRLEKIANQLNRTPENVYISMDIHAAKLENVVADMEVLLMMGTTL